MRVLWITNLPLPDMQKHLGAPVSPFGGWLTATAESLRLEAGIELGVASISEYAHDLVSYSSNSVRHFAIPYGRGNLKYNKEYEQYWKEIDKLFSPDVVHIHGTEFSHGLAYIEACGSEKVVVSIQGLVSVIERYCTGGISRRDRFFNLTIRDLLCGTSINRERKQYIKRGIIEINTIRKIMNVIGRTTWDHYHVLSINPNIHYYSVNETLRAPFYEGHWDYSSCIPHSIFLSQGSSALKGAHMVIKALPFVVARYPDVKVRIAGSDLLGSRGLISWLKMNNYVKYLRKLIKRLDLERNIAFIGVLSAEEIKNELLKSNLFICPSSIENSPNSLGEAQILGVPCLASYVGGIPDMMDDGFYENMYRFEEYEYLAEQICNIFEKRDKQKDFSSIALIRHDKSTNMKNLVEVYNKIMKEQKM